MENRTLEHALDSVALPNIRSIFTRLVEVNILYSSIKWIERRPTKHATLVHKIKVVCLLT